MDKIKEEVITNSVGSGAVAGIGVNSPTLPNQAEPGRKAKKTFQIIKDILKRK
jgi:hypothetical protein